MALTRAEFIAASLAGIGCAAFGLRRTQAADSMLKVIQSEPPRSMDAADHTATFTASILGTMYEGLTQYDEKLQLQPCLATEWTTDPAQTAWTFTLRPNVNFHDGTKFGADAVVASFERHLDTKRGLASSGRFRAVIAKVEAVDPAHVRFTLKNPYPAFLRLLAINNAAIVSPTADKAGTLGRHSVGTGPYRFVEWATADYVMQERNPTYWGKQSFFERIRWGWTSESSVMNMALQTGDAGVVSPLPPVFAAGVKARPDSRLLESDSAAIFWVALNTKLPPFDDVRVRQAINYATDRQALVKSLLYGFGTPANGPMAPVTFGYDPTLQGYSHDVAKAKALLAEAGHSGGIDIDVAVQEPQANLTEALQGMWAEAGIRLNIRRMESGVWTAAAFGNPQQKAQQNIGGVLASWAAGTFDADLQLRPLYHTASASPGGANLGFYSNPTLDGLLEKAGASADPAERLKLYAQAQRIIVQDAPHVLLYNPKDLAGEDAKIQGLWLIPGGQVMPRGAHLT